MEQSHNLAILIPALNEEETIGPLIREIPTGVARWIIVIDNGSTDQTAQVARAAGALVVEQPQRGYGRACWTGFQKAHALGAEIIVYMDGDGSDDPADLTSMLAPLISGNADLVIGSRVTAKAERNAVPAQALLGNWLVSRLINLRYQTQLHDVGSFRVIRSEHLSALQMHEMTFGWPVEMLVKAARADYRIQELPIHYRRRRAGSSKVAGNLIGSVRAAYCMLSTAMRYTTMGRVHV